MGPGDVLSVSLGHEIQPSSGRNLSPNTFSLHRNVHTYYWSVDKLIMDSHVHHAKVTTSSFTSHAPRIPAFYRDKLGRRGLGFSLLHFDVHKLFPVSLFKSAIPQDARYLVGVGRRLKMIQQECGERKWKAARAAPGKPRRTPPRDNGLRSPSACSTCPEHLKNSTRGPSWDSPDLHLPVEQLIHTLL